MKLKFRADEKDWKMFGIFCVALLYFVAVVVLNVVQFAKGDLDHPFHGLNPLPAFTPDFIGLTLFCYVIALVFTINSVKDKFFDREKGFGFSTEAKKTTKGYSRWTTEKELKKELKEVNVQEEKASAGGIPLMNDGKKMWVDDGEGHNIIIGSTGAGKTQIAIFPLVHSLAKHDESMIITDPKGEIYEETSEMLRKKGYNVVLLNFRNPQRGSGWNPLHLPYKYYKEGNTDKANELTDDLAMNILYDENAQNSDPFWEKTSADYFSGICLGLFEDAKEEEINLNSVNAFTTVGEEKCGPNSVYVNEYFKSKDPNSPAYISASSTVVAPNETRGSILSVFKQKIRLFASRANLSEMLSHSDFDFEEIGSKKTAVFIIVQDEKKTYHSLVTIFLKQCYEALVDYAQKNGGKLPYRTNFILDEFANMPPLKDVDTMVSAARSRKMRFYFVIQNYAQLAEVYGKEKGDTIRGNCTNIVYLISTELAALKEISEMCGEYEVKEKDKDGKEKKETRPLITVSDLQKLKFGEMILLRLRMNPFRTKIKPNFEIDWGSYEKVEKAVYPDREKEKVHIFDLKAFVNKVREDKMKSLVDSVMPGLSTKMQQAKTPNDIMKSIDAKIAELEAEERRKSKARKVDTKLKEEVKPKPELIKPTKEVKPEIIKPVKEAKPKVEITKPTKEEKPKKEVVINPIKMPKKPLEEKPRIISKTEIKDKPVKKEKKTVSSTPKTSKANNISSKDFAAKITNRVNTTVNKKTVQKEDIVTDDQFFDDFFSDDE